MGGLVAASSSEGAPDELDFALRRSRPCWVGLDSPETFFTALFTGDVAAAELRVTIPQRRGGIVSLQWFVHFDTVCANERGLFPLLPVLSARINAAAAMICHLRNGVWFDAACNAHSTS